MHGWTSQRESTRPTLTGLAGDRKRSANGDGMGVFIGSPGGGEDLH